jgi:hypothetical protein
MGLVSARVRGLGLVSDQGGFRACLGLVGSECVQDQEDRGEPGDDPECNDGYHG